MLKTILLLPDGTELSSGTGEANAIKSVSITHCVNDEQELSLGSVCAAMIELTVIAPNGGFSIGEGDTFTVLQEDAEGRHQIGVFLAEKPERASANTFKLTAYDRVSLLDRDLSAYLAGLTAWPYTLYSLAQMVCGQCGVELVTESIPNGDHLVWEFAGTVITGRQVMHWIGQLSGRFCRATPEGKVEFAWYCPAEGVRIGPAYIEDAALQYDGEGNVALEIGDAAVSQSDGAVTLDSGGVSLTADSEGNVSLLLPRGDRVLSYYQGGLKYEDYWVAPVEKVQLKNSQEDVGTVYPADGTGSRNTYVISGNPLGAAVSAQSLTEIAQSLYAQLSEVSYVPGSVTIPAGLYLRAGDTVNVTDANGVSVTFYIMKAKQTEQRVLLEGTGSARRDSTTAVNKSGYKSLAGKVLNLTTTVDGLKAENRDTAGKAAALQLSIDGIDARVERNEQNIAQLRIDAEGISAEVERQTESIDGISQDLTRIEQKADSVKISVDAIRENGTAKVTTSTGYTFGADGLRIQKAGQEMENLLDDTGMTVSRGDTVMLRADKDGVLATDVTVRNYLIVGSHARFEDHSDGRTACFWI